MTWGAEKKTAVERIKVKVRKVTRHSRSITWGQQLLAPHGSSYWHHMAAVTGTTWQQLLEPHSISYWHHMVAVTGTTWQQLLEPHGTSLS